MEKYLQSPLPEQKQEKVNEISRYDVIEEHAEVMYELVVSNVPIGVPQGSLEGELADGGLADVQHLLPGRVAVISRCYVVHRDLSLSVNLRIWGDATLNIE